LLLLAGVLAVVIAAEVVVLVGLEPVQGFL